MTLHNPQVFVETPDGETQFSHNPSEGHVPRIGETIRLTVHNDEGYEDGEKWRVHDIDIEYRDVDKSAGSTYMTQYTYLKVERVE